MTFKAAINVALAFDDRMALPAMSVIKSLERIHAQEDAIVVHIMHDAHMTFDVSSITKTFESPTVHIVLYQAKNDYSHLISEPRFSKATFYRFELFECLRDLQRCIYLDADTLVRRNLRSLYATDMGEYCLAACADLGLKYLLEDNDWKIPYLSRSYNKASYLKEVLGMTSTRYLNAGVMVADLDLWNRNKIGARAIEFCLSHPGLWLLDQDAINHALNGRFLRLDPRWNSFAYIKRHYADRKAKPRSSAWNYIMETWSNDAWIAHFSAESKPWMPEHVETPYDLEFWDNIMETPFSRALQDEYIKRVMRHSRRERGSLKKIPNRYNLLWKRLIYGF